MANKTGKGGFTSDNQPEKRRGQLFRTMAVEALKKKAMTEQDFVDLLVEKAVDEGGVHLQELLKRYYPVYKQTQEPIAFEYAKDWTPLEKADAIMSAASKGEIPPDIASMLIEALGKMILIEDQTDWVIRLKALEDAANAKAP